MKFNYCIGNPPYQADAIGDNSFTPSVFNDFMDAAYTISDKVELITPAKFLFNAGNTPKNWNEKMLSDKHLKVLSYSQDSRTVFGSSVSISGGVAITYHDATAEYEPIGIFQPFNELKTILDKISNDSAYASLGEIVFIQTRLNLDVLYKEHPEYEKKCGKDPRLERNIFEKIDCFSNSEGKDDIKILGLSNRKRCWKYISKKYIDLSHENLFKYKVLMSASNGGAGNICDEAVYICGEPYISYPNEGYTRTFVGIGNFNSLKEAENLAKYIKTKFCRVTLGSLKATQLMNKDVWNNIPMQNFTDKSDIDWSKSIREIDQQLYKKYSLSTEEVGFIESHIKEMN